MTTPEPLKPLGGKMLALLIGGTLLIALGVGAMLSSCGPLQELTGMTPAQGEQLVAQFTERTTAAMKAAGVDPATATEEQWAEFGQPIAEELLTPYLPAGGTQEPAQDWWDVGLGLLGTWAGVQGSVVGAQVIAAIARGRRNRASANVEAILKPTSLPDTLKALSALALGTHTPEAAKTATP